jgi:hypothetical protein
MDSLSGKPAVMNAGKRSGNMRYIKPYPGCYGMRYEEMAPFVSNGAQLYKFLASETFSLTLTGAKPAADFAEKSWVLPD